MTEPLLELRDLHVWFDLADGRSLHALRGASLDVGAGEALGLVGESGSGKTTAMLALMGLLGPSATLAGQVLFEGADLLARGEPGVRPRRWRDIAIVFQGAMNSFSPVTRIGDQIAEPMRLHGIADRQGARRRVAELLELVGIPPARARSFPHELSGGMRQRAAIAMALACRPKLLLADEPTTALDVIVQAQILDLLERLRAELGLSIILVTHDLPVVAQVCDRAAVMYAGRTVELGAMEHLYRDAQHPYTRLLFAATPELVNDREVASIPGAPPRLDDELTGCAFAPRCRCAFALCSARAPRSVVVGPAHESECHLVDPAVS